MSEHCSRLNPLRLAIAFGVASAVGLLIMAWLAALTGWATGLIQLVSSAYLGYKATFLGGVIGAAWGFVDGFIMGLIIAWIYNGSGCGCCCCNKKPSTP